MQAIKTLQPKRPSEEERITAWFERFYTTGASLSTFFAGFTLSIATSSAGASRDYAALSSLLFVLNVLVCSAFVLVVNFRKPEIEGILGGTGKSAIAIHSLPLVVTVLFLIAVLFFFLVMKEYTPAAGDVGLAFSGLFILAGLGIWGWQNRAWLFQMCG